MKNTRKVVKEAIVLLVATVMLLTTVSATTNTNPENKVVKSFEKVEFETQDSINTPLITKGVFSDDFESHPDFVLDFPPWTQYDGDGSETYGFESYEFPNDGYVGSYIIFNPSQCTPPLNDPPHSGEKYAACFNAIIPAENDDWLFTPQLSLIESGDITFWAKRGSEQYNPDLFEVGVSITDTDPSSFTIISDLEEPATTWTEYSYNIDNFIGEDIYVGIHCVSFDAFWLGIDDFSVSGVDFELDPDLSCEGDLHFGNVTAGETLTGSFDVENIGGGLLGWQIIDEPSWGTWSFNPEQGDDLEVGSPVTVQVTVIAPEEKNDYAGVIVVENKDNPEDYCTIDVSMTTPKNKAINTPFLNFLENYLNMFPLVQRLFLLLGL